MTDTTSSPHSSREPRDRSGVDYRFDTFRTSLLVDDMWFRRTDPGPGDHVPHFRLPTLDGGTFSSDDLGSKPILMIFGSRTCPVTESAVPRLDELHREFGDRVRFVFVNTREAHPGDSIPQPATIAEKHERAEALRDHHGITYEVAVDDIDGSLHRHFTPKPNSAYLIRPGGAIAHRAHWANDDTDLRRAITDVLAGTAPRGQSRAMIRPLMRAVGHLPGIVQAGGAKIERDVWRAATPLAVLARLSRLFKPLTTDRRGPAAALTLVAIIAIVAGLAMMG